MRETHEEELSEFEKCVTERMAENPDLTREQAEALCKPATQPEDEPTPFESLDQEELSPWQKCIKGKLADGMTMEEAAEKCKEEGITKGDQDAAFDNCVERLMNEGITREEAEKECRAEHPVAEEDQAEQTPLERCIQNKKDEGMTEDEAKEWCEAELAGEHEQADSLIDRSKKLIDMKTERDIERRRAQRRNPL